MFVNKNISIRCCRKSYDVCGHFILQKVLRRAKLLTVKSTVNMQFSGLNKIHSQLTAYIQAKLRVRLRFRVRVRVN